ITVLNSDTQQTYTENVEVEPGRGQAFNKTVWPPRLPVDPTPGVTIYDKTIMDVPTAQIQFWRSRMQVPGTYSFTIKTHGFPKKKAKWVVNFVDSKNYIEYELDDKTLKYTIHQNGSERPGKPVSHSVSASKADSFDVAVDVATNATTVSIGGQRIPTDSPENNGNLLEGKFGFPQGENWDNNFK